MSQHTKSQKAKIIENNNLNIATVDDPEEFMIMSFNIALIARDMRRMDRESYDAALNSLVWHAERLAKSVYGDMQEPKGNA